MHATLPAHAGEAAQRGRGGAGAGAGAAGVVTRSFAATTRARTRAPASPSFSPRSQRLPPPPTLLRLAQNSTAAGGGGATPQVKFAALSKEVIADYVRSGEPFDKAGGYGIQARRAPSPSAARWQAALRADGTPHRLQPPAASRRREAAGGCAGFFGEAAQRGAPTAANNRCRDDSNPRLSAQGAAGSFVEGIDGCYYNVMARRNPARHAPARAPGLTPDAPTRH